MNNDRNGRQMRYEAIRQTALDSTPRAEESTPPSTAHSALPRPPVRTTHSIVVLDFDGTAANIVDDPADAQLHPDVAEAVRRLHGTQTCVAFVSGRPVSFLQSRLPATVDVIVGIYGLQQVRDGIVIENPLVDPFRPTLQYALKRARQELPGVLIEDKDGLAITAHWRTQERDEVKATRAFVDIAADTGLQTQRARKAIELVAPIQVSKSLALADIARNFTRVLYAGDDAADVPPLHWLRAALAEGSVAEVLGVAVGSTELPESLRNAADIVVNTPSDLAELLDNLDERWQHRGCRSPERNS